MVEPKVRFKQDNGSSYPEWIEYTVADIFEKIKTKNKDCRNNNVITNSAEFGLVNQRDFFDKDIAVEGKTENYTIIKKGDFVYNPRKSSHAPMGPFNCYRLEDDGIVSPLYTCLRPKNVLNAEYLLWFFQTDKWHDYVNEHGAQNGARHDRVGMTDSIMMGIPINAPCPEEQEKIAGFLGTINELIASSEKEVEKYKELKKGCLQKMFPKDGASVPEVRFPGFTDEWEQRKLGEWCNFINGDRSSNYPSATEFVEDGIPFVGSDSLGSTLVDKTKLRFITSEKYEQMNGLKIEKNDILYTLRGAGFGKCSIADFTEGTVASSLVGIRCTESLRAKFLIQWLSSGNAENEKNKAVNGSTAQNISVEDMKKYCISVPCIAEQDKISEHLYNLDNLITLHQRECDKYKELKKGLLQQMFI